MRLRALFRLLPWRRSCGASRDCCCYLRDCCYPRDVCCPRDMTSLALLALLLLFTACTLAQLLLIHAGSLTATAGEWGRAGGGGEGVWGWDSPANRGGSVGAVGGGAISAYERRRARGELRELDVSLRAVMRASVPPPALHARQLQAHAHWRRFREILAQETRGGSRGRGGSSLEQDMEQRQVNWHTDKYPYEVSERLQNSVAESSNSNVSGHVSEQLQNGSENLYNTRTKGGVVISGFIKLPGSSQSHPLQQSLLGRSESDNVTNTSHNNSQRSSTLQETILFNKENTKKATITDRNQPESLTLQETALFERVGEKHVINTTHIIPDNLTQRVTEQSNRKATNLTTRNSQPGSGGGTVSSQTVTDNNPPPHSSVTARETPPRRFPPQRSLTDGGHGSHSTPHLSNHSPPRHENSTPGFSNLSPSQPERPNSISSRWRHNSRHQLPSGYNEESDNNRDSNFVQNNHSRPFFVGRNRLDSQLSVQNSSTAATLGSRAAVTSPAQRGDGGVEAGVEWRIQGSGAGVTSDPRLSYCPAVPPTLRGAYRVNISRALTLSEDDVIRTYPFILPGGTGRPQNCTARHRVVVVIPFRARERHLTALLYHLHPLLIFQQLHYRVLVVEQAGNATFNKARLMNTGFLEAARRWSLQCVVFHDVDLVPEDERNMYSCPHQPRHLSVAVDQMNYRLAYPELVGGVLNMRSEHFQRVNGYSNLYWGWGAEDDDMAYRIQEVGLQITRPPENIARYRMLKHDKRLPANRSKRTKLLLTGRQRFPLDGLNSLRYKLLSLTERPLYTHLLVEVGRPPRAYS